MEADKKKIKNNTEYFARKERWLLLPEAQGRNINSECLGTTQKIF